MPMQSFVHLPEGYLTLGAGGPAPGARCLATGAPPVPAQRWRRRPEEGLVMLRLSMEGAC